MKIIVCTDGSEHSKKALGEASVIAEGCNVDEVAIMNVFEPWSDAPFPYEGTTPEQKFDMIVIGSRGLGGLKKLFLGSVSNAIIQEIENCSVLVVK